MYLLALFAPIFYLAKGGWRAGLGNCSFPQLLMAHFRSFQKSNCEIACLIALSKRVKMSDCSFSKWARWRGVRPLCPFFTSLEPQKMVAVRGSKVAVVYSDGSRQGSWGSGNTDLGNPSLQWERLATVHSVQCFQQNSEKWLNLCFD